MPSESLSLLLQKQGAMERKRVGTSFNSVNSKISRIAENNAPSRNMTQSSSGRAFLEEEERQAFASNSPYRDDERNEEQINHVGSETYHNMANVVFDTIEEEVDDEVADNVPSTSSTVRRATSEPRKKGPKTHNGLYNPLVMTEKIYYNDSTGERAGPDEIIFNEKKHMVSTKPMDVSPYLTIIDQTDRPDVKNLTRGVVFLTHTCNVLMSRLNRLSRDKRESSRDVERDDLIFSFNRRNVQTNETKITLPTGIIVDVVESISESLEAIAVSNSIDKIAVDITAGILHEIDSKFDPKLHLYSVSDATSTIYIKISNNVFLKIRDIIAQGVQLEEKVSASEYDEKYRRIYTIVRERFHNFIDSRRKKINRDQGKGTTSKTATELRQYLENSGND